MSRLFLALLRLFLRGELRQPTFRIVVERGGAAGAADGIRFSLVRDGHRSQPTGNDALGTGVVAVGDGKRRPQPLLADRVERAELLARWRPLPQVHQILVVVALKECDLPMFSFGG